MANYKYFEKLKKSLAGGVHYNFKTLGEESPKYFKKGQGSRIWDIEDNEYLDFYAKFGAMILGHNHPELNQALIEQINTLIAVNHTDQEVAVCELIQKYFPSFELMRFGLSGTEVIQNAIRLSRAYTGKTKFLRFEGHYHGNMDNIMGGKYNDVSEIPYPIDFTGDPRGTKGRVPGIFEKESYLIPWNDLEKLKNTLELYGHEIAAIITEPALINGGGIAPKEGYLAEMRKLCDQYGIVLIFDEVITGLRFGLSGAQGFYKVKPDLTILGKAVGGGLPVSILGGKKEIMQLYEKREVVHAGTFNGYPLGLAAVKATFTILEKDHQAFYHQADYYCKEIKNLFESAAASYGLDMSVSTFGSMLVFNVCQETPQSVSELTFDTVLKNSILFHTLPKHGILISPMTRLFLNAMFNDEDLDFFKKKITVAVEECALKIENVYNGQLK